MNYYKESQHLWLNLNSFLKILKLQNPNYLQTQKVW